MVIGRDFTDWFFLNREPQSFLSKKMVLLGF